MSQITTTKVRANQSTSVLGLNLLRQAYKKMPLWHAGYQYDDKKINNYISNPLIVNKIQEKAIIRNFHYVRVGAINVIYGLTPEKNRLLSPEKMLDSLLVQELYEMNKQQYLCLYTASLLNVLLSREPSLNTKKLRYVQGFIKTNPSDSYRTPDGNKVDVMFTVHAFNTYEGIVLDTNVSQVERYRDHELEQDYVIGSNGAKNEIFSHHGFNEYPGTVLRYIKQFATNAGMSVEEWVSHHQRNSMVFSKS
ncbi:MULTISPECIES: hypothetical protein [unclassified Brevibacillus]|uniref:hypothetical protein n=1 Tax=unclassified Brevibacillus TaxID=2684853 RepID=UPI0035695987